MVVALSVEQGVNRLVVETENKQVVDALNFPEQDCEPALTRRVRQEPNGARGLRQGDPLSSFIFFLAMHVLSKMLNLAATKRVFGYHPKCKRIGLTHLSFADDLMIFCKGNADSIMGILIVLDHYNEISGLHLNSSKCEIFIAGCSSRTLDFFQQITGLKNGSLPVRYLGIPLVTRKLTEKYCAVLIDKIKQRLHHWSNRDLSYAGRLELIRSVLFSVSNYWYRHLILPHSILLKVDQLCSRFFWKGEEKAVAGARVNWEFIYFLKAEGGLGLKNTKTWNKACTIDLIRKILVGDGSLWVAWLKFYIFKEHEFWNYVAGSNVRWNINRMLKMHPTVFPIFSTSDSLRLRDIWDSIRNKREKVSCHKLIWFPLHIPKFSLIAWMALLNRLPTRDRLLKMGINTEWTCVNCSNDQETRNHLFTQCTLVFSSLELHSAA
ncbi:uncharacterized protein LOC120132944 [Hibiscus syriacus]|uniref:uncharacterized protein LOC120132944 n=1 Tax=Hibiscus syriacus TaxID=106335 RepID=UPI001921BBF8|nr:uncharacterized protein LOC120132944 [Hibiscus syriacus]